MNYDPNKSVQPIIEDQILPANSTNAHPGVIPVNKGGERGLEGAPTIRDQKGLYDNKSGEPIIPDAVHVHEGEPHPVIDTQANAKPSRLNKLLGTPRRKAIAAGTVVLVAAGVGGGVEYAAHASSHRDAASHSANQKPGTPPKTKIEVDPATASSPQSLDQYFLTQYTFNDILVNGNGPVITDAERKERADNLWSYFSDNLKENLGSLKAWEAAFLQKSPYLMGAEPVLRNGPEVLNADNTQQEVTADSFAVGSDGNYTIDVTMGYNQAKRYWQIENYIVDSTEATQ